MEQIKKTRAEWALEIAREKELITREQYERECSPQTRIQQGLYGMLWQQDIAVARNAQDMEAARHAR